jgi:hypothetical protein
MNSWLYRVSSQFRETPRSMLAMVGLHGQPHQLNFGLKHRYLSRFVVAFPNSQIARYSRPRRDGAWLSGPVTSFLTYSCLRRHPICRYCPLCIAADPVPYLRLSDQVASSYLCNRHKCALREFCPSCQARFDIDPAGVSGVSRTAWSPLVSCQHCGVDLRERGVIQLPKRISKKLLWIQQSMYGVLLTSETSVSLGLDNFRDMKVDLAPLFRRAPACICSARQRSIRDMKAVEQAGTGPSQQIEFARQQNGTEQKPYGCTCNSKAQFPYAIDGTKIFGEDSIAIASYLMSAQFLNGSTAWWPKKFETSELLPLDFSGMELDRAAARARIWLNAHSTN